MLPFLYMVDQLTFICMTFSGRTNNDGVANQNLREPRVDRDETTTGPEESAVASVPEDSSAKIQRKTSNKIQQMKRKKTMQDKQTMRNTKNPLYDDQLDSSNDRRTNSESAAEQELREPEGEEQQTQSKDVEEKAADSVSSKPVDKEMENVSTGDESMEKNSESSQLAEGGHDQTKTVVPKALASQAAPQEPASTASAVTKSVGPTKPAQESSHERITRLTKLVDGFRKKVDRLQLENSQLEEFTTKIEATNNKYSEEIATLRGSMDQLLKSKEASEERAALSDNKVVDLEKGTRDLKERIQELEQALRLKEKESINASAERNASETHIISSLRKDVEAAENLLEEERKAHAASRRSFASREQQLESSMAEAAASMAEAQKKVDSLSHKLSEAYDRSTMLETEIDRLSQQLAIEKTKSRNSDNNNGETSQVRDRLKEIEEELSDTIRDRESAKIALKSASDDIARLQAENDDLRRRIAKSENSDVTNIKYRLQEVTDALYLKQSQIEQLTAENGVLQMQLDRQSTSSRADTLRRRAAAVDKVFNGPDDYENLVPITSLGAGYDRLANAPGHLGGAVQAGAKFLDSTASHAVILIRRYPLWRLGFFFYLIGTHLFIYVLLHRLQHQIVHRIDMTDDAALNTMAVHNG